MTRIDFNVSNQRMSGLTKKEREFLGTHLPLKEIKELKDAPFKNGRKPKTIEKLRHARLALAIKQGKSERQAMIEAGFSRKVAEQGKTHQPTIRATIEKARLEFIQGFQRGMAKENFTGDEAGGILVNHARTGNGLVSINAIRTMAHVQRDNQASPEHTTTNLKLGIFVVPEAPQVWEDKAKEMYAKVIEAEIETKAKKPDQPE